MRIEEQVMLYRINRHIVQYYYVVDNSQKTYNTQLFSQLNSSLVLLFGVPFPKKLESAVGFYFLTEV